jgi:type IV pilus assembly protein PilA
MDAGTYPADNSEAGLEVSTAINGKYVDEVTVAAGVITVTYGGAANTNIHGDNLTLTPVAAAANLGSVSWTCASPLQNKWMPAACRTP